MPLTSQVADAFGAVTISLVILFILLGFFCILRLLHFHARIRRRSTPQLCYFSGPWFVRLSLILFFLLWSLGEVLRLSLLRKRSKFLSLSLKWQEDLCKIYLISNLGFSEPCLFLSLVLLLHASLQRQDSGTLSRQWNRKTMAYIFLFCLPAFLSQLVVVLIGPRFNTSYKNEGIYSENIPKYFTSAIFRAPWNQAMVLCAYPLLSTILLGLFASILVGYFLYLAAKMVTLVINRGLQKRIYYLIFSLLGLLPLRILLLGFSVLSHPGELAFEILVFLAFLVLLICAGVGASILVYCPVSDSLAVRGALSLDMGVRSALSLEISREMEDDNTSLIASQALIEASPNRNSDASTKGGSISFRTMVRDAEGSSPGSPPLPGRPMMVVPLQEFVASRGQRLPYPYLSDV
ncbi:uncharacterized protein LOC18427711 [Amborella trichopoda]|uniref:Uncharacterized protein n=1 Tax=Amborella trichopoda TaxID=13333 RepID=W1NWN6_AMBTC|nr:uncharacterized protein LOC18427711 [Amborella trichopoda]ERM99675.1 hypothetical protein AMTR_s00099p00042390 [Amborella trichopoda]|eukprot:XP_006836822.1 uncharacterized protein LOC18427711 [Amborella trichopoda]